MSTTALFAEILIVGLQALAWVGVIILSFVGTDWIDPVRFREWSTPLTVGLLASAYVLGVLVDRFSDSALHPLDRLLQRGSLGADASRVTAMRMALLASKQGTVTFLEYIRSRLRIARSTAVNAVLAALVISAVSRSGSSPIPGAHVPLAVGGCLLLATVSAWAWVRISQTYYRRLAECYQILTTTPRSARDD